VPAHTGLHICRTASRQGYKNYVWLNEITEQFTAPWISQSESKISPN